MELSEFLELTGWTKAQVSRHVGVSKAAVGQWCEIPERYAEDLRLEAVRQIDPPKPVKAAELSDDELREVIRTRGSISDWDICQSHGWRVWEFNRMIADLVKRHPMGDDFWGGPSCGGVR